MLPSALPGTTLALNVPARSFFMGFWFTKEEKEDWTVLKSGSKVPSWQPLLAQVGANRFLCNPSMLAGSGTLLLLELVSIGTLTFLYGLSTVFPGVFLHPKNTIKPEINDMYINFILTVYCINFWPKDQ